MSERDICAQYMTPALQQATWDLHMQVREEVSFTNGRIVVRGQLCRRGERKQADYILFHTPNLPIAIIEAKDNKYTYATVRRAWTEAQRDAGLTSERLVDAVVRGVLEQDVAAA